VSNEFISHVSIVLLGAKFESALLKPTVPALLRLNFSSAAAFEVGLRGPFLLDELDHPSSLGRPFPASFDKGFCRDTKSRVQSLNHLECQRSPTVEHLMDAVTAADERD
jgi:hypothetical protein